jgi:predicted XRE-type DNA-binding protein
MERGEGAPDMANRGQKRGKNRGQVEGRLISVYATTPIHHANLDMRRELMTYISDGIAEARLSQAQAARLLGVTQPRISNLMRGRVESFSIDSLVNMLGRQGMRVVVSFELAR